MSYIDIVAFVALQCRDEDARGFATYVCYGKESSLSDKLGMKLREQSGTDAVDVAGVPQSFTGISFAAMPRDLRTAFLCGVPNTTDLDMCASDQQCIAVRYPDLEHMRRYTI